MSVTTAPTFVKIGAHAGDVMLQTRISPSRTSEISCTVFTTRAGPSTTPGDGRSVQLGPPSWLCAHARTRSVVMPQSMFSTGSLTSSGMAPMAGGASSPRAARASPCDARRSAASFAERLAARRPHQDELVERRLDLGAGELEDVFRVLQVSVRREERPELAHLVPPAREEPVVAEELVLLDVREDHAREPEQLVEALARLLVEQRAVLLGEPVPLSRKLLRRALDLSPLVRALTYPMSEAYGMLGSSSQLP